MMRARRRGRAGKGREAATCDGCKRAVLLLKRAAHGDRLCKSSAQEGAEAGGRGAAKAWLAKAAGDSKRR